MAHRRPHAFSLIELGLAVALAAILTLAIVVAAHAARRRAHHAACLHHAGQLVFAFHRYAADHAGFLPPDDDVDWWDRVTPHLPTPDMLVCPADPDFADAPDGLSYFWRENHVIDLDDLAAHGRDASRPEPYSFSGRHRDTIGDPTLITVFEELAEMHRPDRLNAATFAGDARSVTMAELEADLRRRVE